MLLLKQLLTFVTSPLSVLLLCLIVTTMLSLTRWRKAARNLLVAVVAVTVVLSAIPVGRWMLIPLEDRFPQSTQPTTVDGIIVLGGVGDPLISDARGQIAMGGSAERLTEMLPLAKRYPNVPIVLSGGRSASTSPGRSEAELARTLLARFGFDTTRLRLESRSSTTYENALFSKELIQPKPGERWIIVTTARHMPRAVGAFRGVGWPVVPHPVDYATDGNYRPYLSIAPLRNLMFLEAAVYEWRGLFHYYLSDRSPELFPGPTSEDSSG